MKSSLVGHAELMGNTQIVTDVWLTLQHKLFLERKDVSQKVFV